MSICVRCQKPVFFAERVSALGFDWHKSCFRCANQNCDKILVLGKQSEEQKKLYCAHCHSILFGRQQSSRGSWELKVPDEQKVVNTTIRNKMTIIITMVPKVFTMKF